ncbi:MAG: hypothetical protein OSA49_05970 [Ascidiaceihabitans sp.]|nr:hypothetical protein [Ascidiaceihabitans sp.]
MAYEMGGGNTDYDPSLMGLPSNTFQEMDGSFLDVKVADLTPDDGGPIMKSSWHVGRAVNPDHMPTKLRRTGPPISRAKLLDVNNFAGSLDLVCQTFKDIVEEFEPDVHQFFPMTYYNSKGTEVIGEGYFMVICQRISTLHETLCVPPLDERGRYKSTSVEESPDYQKRDKSLDRKVYSTSKIGGRHMWHDIKNAGPFMFSNALGERLIGANLSGLVYWTYEEA